MRNRLVRKANSNMISAPTICPVRGFVKEGPYPPNGGLGEEVQRRTLYRRSPASHSASSGCTLISIAFVNPAFSKDLFHSRPASLMRSLYSYGVVFSIHQTMGWTGSDSFADGSFFCKCQRLITSRYGTTLRLVKSVIRSVKYPIR